MKIKAFSKIIILSMLAMIVVAGCSGKNGSTGTAGTTGVTGTTGPVSVAPVNRNVDARNSSGRLNFCPAEFLN